jgi:hypothetical protein
VSGIDVVRLGLQLASEKIRQGQVVFNYQDPAAGLGIELSPWALHR